MEAWNHPLKLQMTEKKHQERHEENNKNKKYKNKNKNKSTQQFKIIHNGFHTC